MTLHIRTILMTALLAALALALQPASACLWDTDTLATELRGLPVVDQVIAGRFVRNPPLYYELRLIRVVKQIAASPGKLELYDDAGVACDRLGQGDDAVAWMAKKKLQLDKLSAASKYAGEHLYRYHANLGTFLAHRWFKNGAKRDQMADLKAGRAHIAEAIRLNPDAHFGREKYQLAAMDWILLAPVDDKGQPPTLLSQIEGELNAEEAVKGLSGLIALGNAWESVDVFHALAIALAKRNDTSVAELARLRCIELLAAGKRSLHPKAPEDYGPAIHLSIQMASIGPVFYSKPIKPYYTKARAAADEWQAKRSTFMNAQFRKGLHPDTHPDFWKGYVDEPAAPLPPERK